MSLKEHMKLLAQSTFSLYEKASVEFDERFKRDAGYISMQLNKLDKDVITDPEFIACVGLMEHDDQIKELQGKLVGSRCSRSIVEDESDCVLSFLKVLYLKSPEYSQESFDEAYASFVDFFYSDQLHYKDSVAIYNFTFSGDEIPLENEISIRKKTIERIQEEHAMATLGYEQFSKSGYEIIRYYDEPKQVGDTSEDRDTSNCIYTDGLQSDDLFDLVVIALRILKPSAVYRGHKIKSELLSFHPMGGATSRSGFIENTVIGDKCNLEKDDISEFQRIFQHLVSESDTRFITSYRRLSSAIERKSREDQIIDYMVGLEALYLPDGSHELSFRLSLRVAFLLATEALKRKKIFLFIKAMYKERSNIVHGNNYNITDEDIVLLDALYRESLKLWIEDKNNFSVNKHSNSGLLVAEGKLDNLFFGE